MVLAKLALDPAPDDFLLEQHQKETDRAKKDNDTAGRLLTGQERNQDDNDGCPGARPEKLPDRLTPGGKQGAVVKALHRQHQRRDWGDDRDHPHIFPERPNFRSLPEKLELPEGSQLVGQPESQAEEARVHQLVKPDADLSLAPQHGFDYLDVRSRSGKSQKTRPTTVCPSHAYHLPAADNGASVATGPAAN